METPKRNLDYTKPTNIDSRFARNTLNKGFFNKKGRKAEERELISPLRGLLLTSALIFYWEMIVEFFGARNIGMNLTYIVCSSVIASSVISIFSGIFKQTYINFIVSTVLKSVLAALFIMEVIYFDISGTYFGIDSYISKYSLKEDWLVGFFDSWLAVILIILPLIISVVFFVLYYRIEEDIFGYSKRSIVNYVIVVLVGVLFYGMLIFFIRYDDSESRPIYDVYSQKTYDYTESTNDFGVLTTFAHSIKWSIFD